MQIKLHTFYYDDPARNIKFPLGYTLYYKRDKDIKASHVRFKNTDDIKDFVLLLLQEETENDEL